MIRPGCYQPERQLLGGVRTRQKKTPFHGALQVACYTPINYVNSILETLGTSAKCMASSSVVLRLLMPVC